MENETPYTDPKRALFQALSKAQSQMKPPAKNCEAEYSTKNGGKVKFKYADLANVLEAIKEPFANNGLSHFHVMHYQDGQFGLTTSINHELGSSVETWYPLPDPSKMGRPQDFASSLTYGRRYSLTSLAGIAADEDDDGAGAVNPEPPRSNTKPTPRGNPQKPQTYPQQAPPPSEPPPPEHDEDDLDRALGDGLPSGDFKIGFGPYAGKTLNQVRPEHLKMFVDFVISRAHDEDRALTGPAGEFVDAANEYLKACGP